MTEATGADYVWLHEKLAAMDAIQAEVMERLLNMDAPMPAIRALTDIHQIIVRVTNCMFGQTLFSAHGEGEGDAIP